MARRLIINGGIVYEKIIKHFCGSVFEIQQHLARPMYLWRDLEQ